MSILRIVLSAILLVSLTRAVPFLKDDVIFKDTTGKATAVNYRLPDSVKPSHYTIKLSPNILEDNFTFTGESSIQITLSKNSTEIVLHARDLVILKKHTTVVKSENETFTPSSQEIDNVTDFLTLKFKTPLLVGEYTLNLSYTGKLHDDLNGFYRSWYLNDEGEKVWLATTQFEPTHARRAFPCFDEPAIKAKFEISIKHHQKYTAVSNMLFNKIERDTENILNVWTHFKVTPVMSTYLIAFVVSDFAYLSSKDGKFRVWSKRNANHNGDYALRVGQKALEALDSYTGITHYSIISKMDNFAIPQFRAGAMENWGIVTYRENGLLYEENVTSTENKQYIATVISHEFAHQWFGNLVSPLWWTYTWLNEGFANYYQYYITAKVEVTWRLMDQFVVKNLQGTAFTADDDKDQHPMNNNNVNDPKQISANFDSIAYSKAGSVIRMISHALTEPIFEKGIKNYLKKNQFKVANSDTLFSELIDAAKGTVEKLDLKKALNSWAEQPGYPVLTVTRNYKTDNVTITQHRFLTKKNKQSIENWVIPINYGVQSNPNFASTKPAVWFDEPINGSITLTGFKKGEWVIFNKQQTGYYRVNYDLDNWSLIINHLKNNLSDIHVLNRAQLLDDAYHLTRAGEITDQFVFLNITTYLKEEVDIVPWIPAFRAFGTLNKILANTKQYRTFKLYLLGLIEELEKKVGYTETEKDDHLTKLHRQNVVQWACLVGSKKCISATQKKLEEYIGGAIDLSSPSISVDLKNVVLCAGLRTANESAWKKTLALYEKSKVETERKVILAALGCSTNPELLNHLLGLSIIATNQTQVVSTDDAIKSVLTGSASGVDIAFDFINAKLKEIINVNNGSYDTVLKNLNDIGSRMNTKAQVDKLEKFIEANKANKELADELNKNALVSAKSNVEWINSNEKSITVFLANQKLEPEVTPKPSGNNNSNVSLPALQLILFALAASVLSLFH